MMRGLEVPDESEDFTADSAELFFDLAYVFAFSQIVHMLLGHPDWEHLGKAALIFLMLWLPWTQFTWAANSVPGNQRIIRLAFLVATAASVPMAAAVETAFDGSGPLFAIPLALIFLMALGVQLSSYEVGSRKFLASMRYSIPTILAMVIIVIGGFVPGTARYVAWIAGVLVVTWTTVKAGDGEWAIRPGHFAERHALIIIVALGEVIVALGNAVVDPLAEGADFDTTSVIALGATGVLAAIMWWSYFDRVQPSLEHGMKGLPSAERGRFARDVYSYAHMPVVAGVILIAVGLENAASHPEEPVPIAFRLMLVVGIALFIAGISTGVYRAFKVFPYERVVTVTIMATFVLLAGSVSAVWLIVLIDVSAIIALSTEHYRLEKRAERQAVADVG